MYVVVVKCFICDEYLVVVSVVNRKLCVELRGNVIIGCERFNKMLWLLLGCCDFIL